MYPKLMVVAVLSAMVVACGGGGGGGGGDVGVVRPPVGEPPAGPPPSLPPQQAEPVLQVDCTHKGAGNEYNVNGPDSAPHRVSSISEVPWETLGPGDTVRIHYRDVAYAEKIVLFRSGSEGQPIRVCGVLGGTDGKQRPVITGVGAVTRTAATFKKALTYTAGSLQTFGVIVIAPASTGLDAQVRHVSIENLSIGNTKVGPGRDVDEDGDDEDDDSASFYDEKGDIRRYNGSAACIRIRSAQHITIRSSQIENCGDGIFAASLPEGESGMTRHLLIEGNYLRHNGIIGDESRHSVYLQGTDITLQFNVFDAMREVPGFGHAGGNQVKTRAIRQLVRYNYILNGARMLDFVEPEEYIDLVVPWQYKRVREQGLRHYLPPDELALTDARQAQDWADMQGTAGHVYGNLLHVKGPATQDRLLPTNIVHGGFDNNQFDRQPGVLWFYNNTVLVETTQSNHNEIRLYDYGSQQGTSYYRIEDPNLKNFQGKLHYLSMLVNEETGLPCPPDDDECDDQQLPCTMEMPYCENWGAIQPNEAQNFGRMRAFNNAFVLARLDPQQHESEFELTRYLWDQLELVGPLWLSQSWNVDSDDDPSNGGGFPQARRKMGELAYPGGDDHHHISGVDQHIRTGALVPVDRKTFAPIASSPLLGTAGPWDARLADSLKPTFSITLDKDDPRRLIVSPRSSLSTIGAVQ